MSGKENKEENSLPNINDPPQLNSNQPGSPNISDTDESFLNIDEMEVLPNIQPMEDNDEQTNSPESDALHEENTNQDVNEENNVSESRREENIPENVGPIEESMEEVQLSVQGVNIGAGPSRELQQNRDALHEKNPNQDVNEGNNTSELRREENIPENVGPTEESMEEVQLSVQGVNIVAGPSPELQQNRDALYEENPNQDVNEENNAGELRREENIPENVGPIQENMEEVQLNVPVNIGADPSREPQQNRDALHEENPNQDVNEENNAGELRREENIPENVGPIQENMEEVQLNVPGVNIGAAPIQEPQQNRDALHEENPNQDVNEENNAGELRREENLPENVGPVQENMEEVQLSVPQVNVGAGPSREPEQNREQQQNAPDVFVVQLHRPPEPKPDDLDLDIDLEEMCSQSANLEKIGKRRRSSTDSEDESESTKKRLTTRMRV